MNLFGFDWKCRLIGQFVDTVTIDSWTSSFDRESPADRSIDSDRESSISCGAINTKAPCGWTLFNMVPFMLTDVNRHEAHRRTCICYNWERNKIKLLSFLRQIPLQPTRLRSAPAMIGYSMMCSRWCDAVHR